MFKWIISLCLLMSYMNMEAHQPDLSSTILVEQEENKWILQIRAALTAFEYEIEAHFGASSYSTPEEFQDLILEYMQEHIKIQFNEKDKVILHDGIVKLGHETTVTFKVEATPEFIQSLMVKNSSFSHISRNQSILMILKQGFSKAQFILNDNNNHQLKLKVKDANFELVPSTQNKNKYSYWAIGIVILVVFFLIKRYSESQENQAANLTLSNI